MFDTRTNTHTKITISKIFWNDNIVAKATTMNTWLGMPKSLGRGPGATIRQHNFHPIIYHVWAWCEGNQFSEHLWETGWLSHVQGMLQSTHMATWGH